MKINALSGIIKFSKKASSTESRTQAKGFKVLCANPYTIELFLCYSCDPYLYITL
jgi:hypothetical protein